MDRLMSMEVFVQVIDCGSFTRAATALRMSTAMVSTHISQTENRLGVRLINRTTRRMELTEDGEAYHAHCRQILSEIRETEALLSSNRTTPQGRLRIDVPMSVYDPLIMPVLLMFRERYPGICLEINISNHAVNITDAGYDVAIRHGEPDNANQIARPMGSSRRVITASPDYLARHGEPATPEDLKHHHCINVLDVHTGRLEAWTFTHKGKTERLEIPGIIAFNQGAPRAELAIQGMGIMQSLSFQVASPLRAGLLKRLLPEWESISPALFLIYQRNRHLSAKLRAFVDFMLELYPAGKDIEPPPAYVVQPIKSPTATRRAG